MDTNERIKALCKRRGYQFKPWEICPWDVDDGPSPYPPGTSGGVSWPKAQALRKRLIEELEAATND